MIENCGWAGRSLRTRARAAVIAALTLMVSATTAIAQEATEAADAAASAEVGTSFHFYLIWAGILLASIVALVQAYAFFKGMMAADPGNPKMVEIAGYVREGANAYLRQQYKIVAVFFVIIFGLLAVAAFVLNVQSTWVPFAFITGEHRASKKSML